MIGDFIQWVDAEIAIDDYDDGRERCVLKGKLYYQNINLPE